MTRFWARERASAATEYMLVLSVVVTGAVASAYTFVPGFSMGVNALSDDVESILMNHNIAGVGTNVDPGSLPVSAAGAPGSTGNSNCGSWMGTCAGNSNAAVGGGNGGNAAATLADQLAALQVYNDPNASAADKAKAKATLIASAPAHCSQTALSLLVGKHTGDVIADTLAMGLTTPDMMHIDYSKLFGSMAFFFGFNMPKVEFPVDYRGYMSLMQMEIYLLVNHVQAVPVFGAKISDITKALETGKKVTLILDVDSNNNPTDHCETGAGHCGHTVRVTSISGDTVRVRDDSSGQERSIPLADFEKGWNSQNNGMIVSTPGGTHTRHT
ncbi:MAG TPA: hypothetical protein VMV18_05315 [bacterium]|nr:hypothetical protein [bacterium]